MRAGRIKQRFAAEEGESGVVRAKQAREIGREALRAQLRLYAVTDRRWLRPGQTLAGQVEQAILGGVTMVQLREKEAGPAERLSLAREVKQVTEHYGVPLLIDDDVETARRVDAAGVHVGQEDLAAPLARQCLGAGKILGVSARTVEQALAAEAAGADYLGAGALFATGSKSDAKRLTVETLREICAAVRIPVVAIGGVSAGNLPLLAGSGIAGVAVISAIFAAPDARAAAAELREALEVL